MAKKRLVVVLIIIVFSLVFVAPLIYANNQTMREINADKIENIKLDVGKAKIIFDQTSNKIHLSDELKTSQTGNNIRIYDKQQPNFFNWFSKEEHKIIIGTAQDYSEVKIDGGGVEVRGNLKADNIIFAGGGMDVNADLIADEVKIDGGGIELQGQFETKNLLVDGGGITINIGVKKTKNLEIDGGGMSVDIKYLDSWAGTRYLTVDGAGNSINLLVPSANDSAEDGLLDVNTDGIIDVNVDYY